MKECVDATLGSATPVQCCRVHEFKPATAPVSTGIGFLDHMLDQFYSHAQIGIDLLISGENDVKEDHNRNAACDQIELLSYVGKQVGCALTGLLDERGVPAGLVSTFACPLDEALTICVLERVGAGNVGDLVSYSLAPYGKFPATGRSKIGKLETTAIESFWRALAVSSGLIIRLDKVRGDNAHHIVESSFKAFSRALRNLLDGIDTESFSGNLIMMYGANSENYKVGIGMKREGTITRETKETSITTILKFDGGAAGIDICTGVNTLDRFLKEFAVTAGISLTIKCVGDLWIDEHHTAEDVAISIGQVISQALGTKAGLNRMWCAASTIDKTNIHVTMDLSNRPCLTHNLMSLETAETIGDLTTEMFEHILDSIVVNAKMTVHIVEDIREDEVYNCITDSLENTVMTTGRAFGQALKYCAMVDGRRSGATASSKGTLSV